MEKNQQPEQKSLPKILAVGGGKGGIGKSVVSILIGSLLARMGNRTILIDADFSGANLHTLLGIKNPPVTLNDFINKKCKSLHDICIELDLENLKLIGGASEVLSQANPQFVQKMKIIQNIFKLEADYIILDLGSGASFNSLDFFLVAHKKIVILTPQPTSIHNAYVFIRNAVYRRISQISRQKPLLQELIKTAMNPNNELKVRTIKDLFKVIQEYENTEVMESLKREIEEIHPLIITNMTRNSNDQNAGRIIQLVAEKYLMVESSNLGEIVYDKQIDKMISEMVPLTSLNKSSEALAKGYEIVMNLLKGMSIISI